MCSSDRNGGSAELVRQWISLSLQEMYCKVKIPDGMRKSMANLESVTALLRNACRLFYSLVSAVGINCRAMEIKTGSLARFPVKI